MTDDFAENEINYDEDQAGRRPMRGPRRRGCSGDPTFWAEPPFVRRAAQAMWALIAICLIASCWPNW